MSARDFIMLWVKVRVLAVCYKSEPKAESTSKLSLFWSLKKLVKKEWVKLLANRLEKTKIVDLAKECRTDSLPLTADKEESRHNQNHLVTGLNFTRQEVGDETRPSYGQRGPLPKKRRQDPKRLKNQKRRNLRSFTSSKKLANRQWVKNGRKNVAKYSKTMSTASSKIEVVGNLSWRRPLSLSGSCQNLRWRKYWKS